MNTYLAIITTVLVATQIIRVTQNWLHLRRYGKEYAENRIHYARWREVVKDMQIWYSFEVARLDEENHRDFQRRVKKNNN